MFTDQVLGLNYFVSLSLFSLADPLVSPNLDISRIGARIIDELVTVMKDVGIDETEFACIKALVFFDPSEFSPGLPWIECFNIYIYLL